MKSDEIKMGYLKEQQKNVYINDVKGKKYLSTSYKFYFSDIGIRNSFINFREQEERSLLKINDSFKKFIMVKDYIKRNRDENGIITMSIFDFLLDINRLEY